MKEVMKEFVSVGSSFSCMSMSLDSGSLCGCPKVVDVWIAIADPDINNPVTLTWWNFELTLP